MWPQLFFILAIMSFAAAIKIPIDRTDENVTEIITEKTLKGNKESDQIQINPSPVYFTSNDADVDSYLIPPDPHQPQETFPDTLVTPATYLIPPSPDKQSDYSYPPTEPGEQSDWQPIANAQAGPIPYELRPVTTSRYQTVDHFKPVRDTRVGKVNADLFASPVPSEHLAPPAVNAPNDYIIQVPSKHLELPIEEYRPAVIQPSPVKHRNKPLEPIRLALRLTPPRPVLPTIKIPTNLYPKKYNSGFKPVLIPIAQYAHDSLETPRAKPMKLIKPVESSEIDYFSPIDDKKYYQYHQAEHKRKVKDDGEHNKQHQFVPSDEIKDSYEANSSAEQVTLETNHGYPGRNVYPVPLRQAPPSDPPRGIKHQAPNDRTEFRMHGMKGPHSYEFGYDTGKGKNRQFRYEERDNDGQVKGHYGYMDKRGKLRVVNYSAHPELGFHAEAPVEQE